MKPSPKANQPAKAKPLPTTSPGRKRSPKPNPQSDGKPVTRAKTRPVERRAIARCATQDEGAVRRWFARQPPWAVSAATHTAGLLLLSLLSFATFGDAGFSLSATVGEDDAWSDVVA
ncbi:MAG: hypothetical protein AAF805_13755, partial [Planctomycetota bacterium]